MPLDRLSQITEVGIKSGITLRNINVENAYVSGVITATSLAITGAGISIAGVVTATSFDGNVTGRINPTSLNVSGVSTFNANIFLGDGDIAYFGDGQDLLIFHNSTDSIIRDNGTGDLFIEGGNRIKLTNPTGIETYAVFNQDGASELWYDNSKKFETTGAGVSVTGIATATSGFSGNLTGNVNATGLSTFSGGIQVGATTSLTVGSSFIKNNAVGLGETTTTGRNAGINTAIGTIIYNTTNNALEFYNGNWISLTGFVATGGNVVDGLLPGNGYKYHTFTSPGSFVISSGTKSIEILAVAGGGGGGSHNNTGTDGGGGGGAGGVVLATSYPVSPGTYNINVGTGGPGGTANTNNNSQPPGASKPPPYTGCQGTTGGPTVFGASSPTLVKITALGGGGAGSGPNAGNQDNGGSGGGAGSGGNPFTPGGSGLQPSQNPGTLGSITQYGTNGGGAPGSPEFLGAGGGGAGGAGGNGSSGGPGTGGPGVQLPVDWAAPTIGIPSLNPVSRYFGAGGSGGRQTNINNSPIAGGTGGGGQGAGGPGSAAGTGAANGSGGGGGSGTPSSQNAGAPGGNGLLVIRYLA